MKNMFNSSHKRNNNKRMIKKLNVNFWLGDGKMGFPNTILKRNFD